VKPTHATAAAKSSANVPVRRGSSVDLRVLRATPALEHPDDDAQADKEGHYKHGDSNDVDLIDAADDWQVDKFASSKLSPGALESRGAVSRSTVA
jgi:hypothetical protein